MVAEVQKLVKAKRQKLVKAQYVSAHYVADLLSIGDSTVYYLAKHNKIPHVRIGQSIRFDADEVLAALKK